MPEIADEENRIVCTASNEIVKKKQGLSGIKILSPFKGGHQEL